MAISNRTQAAKHRAQARTILRGAFSRSAAQDDIAAAVARVKAKREAKLAAADNKTRRANESTCLTRLE